MMFKNFNILSTTSLSEVEGVSAVNIFTPIKIAVTAATQSGAWFIRSIIDVNIILFYLLFVVSDRDIPL